jgi:hypothetical protein
MHTHTLSEQQKDVDITCLRTSNLGTMPVLRTVSHIARVDLPAYPISYLFYLDGEDFGVGMQTWFGGWWSLNTARNLTTGSMIATPVVSPRNECICQRLGQSLW